MVDLTRRKLNLSLKRGGKIILDLTKIHPDNNCIVLELTAVDYVPGYATIGVHASDDVRIQRIELLSDAEVRELSKKEKRRPILSEID